MPLLLVTTKRKYIVGKVANLFATPFYNAKLGLNLNLLESECYKHKEKDPGVRCSNALGWQSNIITSGGILDDSLIQGIIQSANEFCEVIKIPPVMLDVLWININPKYSYNQPHTHPGCVLSGVYYIKIPDQSGDLVFITPYENAINTSMDMNNGVSICNSLYRITPQEDQILIFPPWVQHLVEQNLSDDDRISVSFNFAHHI